MSTIYATLSNHFKYRLGKKEIDLSADTIKVCLTRSGFVFSPDDHAKLINIRTNSGAISLTFEEDDKSINRGSGSFITDGFVVANKITTDAASNPGPFTIATVEALKITVNEAVVDEGPVTKTVSSDDELQTGSGYTQFTKALSGQALAEDDENNRAELTCDNVSWTASGGDIGPTPWALLIDDSDGDDTIIEGLDLNGEQTAANGTSFLVSEIKIRIS